jgi:hypothetical protein
VKSKRSKAETVNPAATEYIRVQSMYLRLPTPSITSPSLSTKHCDGLLYHWHGNRKRQTTFGLLSRRATWHAQAIPAIPATLAILAVLRTAVSVRLAVWRNGQTVLMLGLQVRSTAPREAVVWAIIYIFVDRQTGPEWIIMD